MKNERTLCLPLPVQPTFHHGGIACCQRIVGDIPCHHTAGGNDAAVPDGHTGADDDSSAQPAVVADGDGVGCLLLFPTGNVIHGMLGGVELAVRPDEGVPSDAYQRTVEKRAVVVDEDSLARHDAVSVVAVEGRADGGALWKAGDEVFDYFPVVGAVDGHGLQTGTRLLGVNQAPGDFRVGEVIKLLATHFLKFCFHRTVQMVMGQR